jgi:hypothetical protein
MKHKIGIQRANYPELSCERNNDFKLICENMIKFIYEKNDNPETFIEALEFISEVFCEHQNKEINYRITFAFYNSLLFYEKYVNAGDLTILVCQEAYITLPKMPSFKEHLFVAYVAICLIIAVR